MSVPQAQAASALLLALAAGTVDAVSFIVLHHTFTANMTGNTTKLGIAAGKNDGAAALPLVVAVAAFVGGAIWAGFGEPRWTTWPLAASIAAILAVGAIDILRPLHALFDDRRQAVAPDRE